MNGKLISSFPLHDGSKMKKYRMWVKTPEIKHTLIQITEKHKNAQLPRRHC